MYRRTMNNVDAIMLYRAQVDEELNPLDSDVRFPFHL